MTVYSDLTAAQERNKDLYKEGRTPGEEFFRYASLPIDFLDVYGFRQGLPSQWYYDRNYMGLLVDIAHDPQYRDFRTTPGNFARRGEG